MVEKLVTGPEPSENQEAEKSIMEEAHDRAEKLKSELEKWRQEVKAKGRSLFGLDLPHAENGQTIEPLPSEVPPVESNEVIPRSYGNLPTEVLPEKPVSLGTPEQQGEVQEIETENVTEVSQNPVPAPRVITGIVAPIKNQFPNLPKYIGPRPKTETKEMPTLPDFHTVQAGETLYGIAKKYNIGLQNLLTMNGLTEQSTIKITQKIALKQGVKSESEKKPEEEKKLAEGLTKSEHVALILATCDDLGVTNVAQRAYILATAEHESDHFKTLTEYSKGKLKKYGKIDESTGHAYYGRGYVQLTWKENYERYDGILKSSGLLGTDQSIVANPELVKNPKIAAFILVHGMINGSFGYIKVDGKDRKARLDMFIDDTKRDWEGARYTVNGTDKKRKIAGQAQEILKLLETK